MVLQRTAPDVALTAPRAAFGLSFVVLLVLGTMGLGPAAAHGDDHVHGLETPFGDQELATFLGDATDLAATADVDGGLHVAWSEERSGHVKYRYRPAGELTWHPVEKVTSTGADLTIGTSEGIPYIVFRDTSDEAGDGRLVMAYRANTTWEAMVVHQQANTGYFVDASTDEKAMQLAWVTKDVDGDADMVHHQAWLFEPGTAVPFGSSDLYDTEIRGELRGLSIAGNEDGQAAILTQNDEVGWLSHSKIHVSQPERILPKALPTQPASESPRAGPWGGVDLSMSQTTGVIEGPYLRAGEHGHMELRLAQSTGVTWQSQRLDIVGERSEQFATPAVTRGNGQALHIVWERAAGPHEGDPGAGLAYTIIDGSPDRREPGAIALLHEVESGADYLLDILVVDLVASHVFFIEAGANDESRLIHMSANHSSVESWIQSRTAEEGPTPYHTTPVEPGHERDVVPTAADSETPGPGLVAVLMAGIAILLFGRRR